MMRARPARSLRERAKLFLATAKGEVLLVFLALLGVAAVGEPVSRLRLDAHVLAAVLAAGLLDVPYLRVESGRWRFPTSGVLTGLIVAMILAPDTPLDLVAAAGAASILGKRLIRVDGEHVFNPAVLGLLWAGWQSSGESWWGALGNAPAVWIGLLLLSGWLTADRLNKLPLVLTFLGSYVGLWTAASFFPAVSSAVDAQLAAEMLRPPFIQAALFLAFFMLTDPPTSPNRYAEQVWYGVLAGGGTVAASLLGGGQLYLLYATAVANLWLAGLRLWQRRSRSQRPQSAPGSVARDDMLAAARLAPSFQR
jgi:Na+-translocating ferredoxin:NAD+ oxidoreductase RnfD subunit